MEIKYDGDNEYLPLRDLVFQALRQAIITGEFSPGERLMEIKIAGAMPIEIAKILSKLNIYKTSFSKYGRGYARKLELERRGIRKYA